MPVEQAIGIEVNIRSDWQAKLLIRHFKLLHKHGLVVKALN